MFKRYGVERVEQYQDGKPISAVWIAKTGILKKLDLTYL